MNSFARRALAASLSAAMFGNALPAVALADATEQPLEVAAEQRVSATVRFMPYSNYHADALAQVPYADSFFTQPAQTYSNDLMLASLGCSLAAGGSAEASSASQMSQNIKAFFASAGFTGYAENADWSTQTTHDTSAVSVAYRDTQVNGKATRIYAIAFRGQRYDHEWYSNLLVGSSGYHQGFTAASQRALSFVQSYINSHRAPSGTQSLMWLSGYSRGGAIANLAAAQILRDGKLGNLSVSPEQVYTYTFEAPATAEAGQASASRNLYASIHNTVDPEDWLCNLFGAGLGMELLGEVRDRSGRPYDASGSTWEAVAFSSSKLQAFYSTLAQICPEGTYGAENFQELSMPAGKPAYAVANGRSQAAYVKAFAPFLFGLFGAHDRASFASGAQTDAANLFEWTLGNGRDTLDVLIAAMRENALKEAQDYRKYLLGLSVASAEGLEDEPAEVQELAQQLEVQAEGESAYPVPTAIISGLRLISVLAGESKVALYLHNVFAASLDTAGIAYSDSDLTHLCDTLAHGIQNNIADGDDFSELATLIANASSINGPHGQEDALAWALTFADSAAPAKTGWYRDAKGLWHYAVAAADGSVSDKIGWLSWSGAWYYLGSNGVMYKNRWLGWAGKWYYFGGDGIMYANRWLSWGGNWFFLGPDGAMFENRWVKYGSDWYYLGGDGIMARNRWIGNDYVDGSGKWVRR